MKPLPPLPAIVWRQRYEALRRYVLERRPVLGTDPLGLVVVFAQGVAGWMQSWSESLSPLAPVLELARPPQYPATPPWQQQLTGLLAHITALHLFGPSP